MSMWVIWWEMKSPFFGLYHLYLEVKGVMNGSTGWWYT